MDDAAPPTVHTLTESSNNPMETLFLWFTAIPRWRISEDNRYFAIKVAPGNVNFPVEGAGYLDWSKFQDKWIKKDQVEKLLCFLEGHYLMNTDASTVSTASRGQTPATIVDYFTQKTRFKAWNSNRLIVRIVCPTKLLRGVEILSASEEEGSQTVVKSLNNKAKTLDKEYTRDFNDTAFSWTLKYGMTGSYPGLLRYQGGAGYIKKEKKRKSTRRKSTRRKSTRRKSTRRKSTKRKSTKKRKKTKRRRR